MRTSANAACTRRRGDRMRCFCRIAVVRMFGRYLRWNAQGRTTMSHTFRATVMIAAAAGALSGMAGERLYAQGADPNAAPNPYKMQENWAQLPEGRKFGAAIKVQVDHSDGKSIWVFDRCGASECTNSTLAPMEQYDSSGKFQKAIGAGMFAVPHGFYVDREGNVWGGDQIARNGKGADLIKFAPDGKVLMILGKPGMHGKAAGEFDTPHGIALDSAGRVYVADRANNRIQIFEPDGKFVAEWKQFGRPSDVAIDKNDMIYVADSQSNATNNPGFKQGIRIGSVKDGKVTAFIAGPSAEAEAPEGVGVDDSGNVYAGWTGKMAVRRFVKQ